MAMKNADINAVRQLLEVLVKMHEHEAEMARIRYDLWVMVDNLLSSGRAPDPVEINMVRAIANKSEGKGNLASELALELVKYRNQKELR